MKILYFSFLFFFSHCSFSQGENKNSIASPESPAGTNPSCSMIVTWNIANLGASKNDEEIAFMAKTVKEFDVVAIQEVSAGPPGTQAVARLADELNRLGSKWDYCVSSPTKGKGVERYAFIWKTHEFRILGKPWLEPTFEHTIDREPFLARFVSGRDTFLIANFHAVPQSKSPQDECRQLCTLDSIYEKDHLLIMGDFNLSHRSPAFASLKSGNMFPSLQHQKTTLKMNPAANGETLANEYDNIFYEEDEIIIAETGIINFYTSFQDLKTARKVSDHVPVWGCYSIAGN